MRGQRKRRWLLALAGMAGLAAAGYATAASLFVRLGPSGPQPPVVTLGWGDTLHLVNGDSVAHGLTSRRPVLRAGAVTPGATFSAVVTGRPGTFAYHQTGGRRLDGTVVLVLPGSVSLQAAKRSVVFGRLLRLSGNTNAGVPVAIEERLAGEQAWHTVVTLTSDGAGDFSLGLPFALGGRVRASIDGGQLRSAPLAVSVSPQLTLTASRHRVRVGRRVSLHARVRPAAAATHLRLYVCSPKSGKWRRVLTTRTSAAGAVTWRFRVPLAAKARLRVQVRRHDLATGYAPGASAPVTVTGIGKKPAKFRTLHRC